MRFSAEDTGIAEAVEHASLVELDGGVRLRVARVAELIELKLLAAEEPRRRRSKREHDLADVSAVLEEHREAASPALLARLHQVRAKLLAGPF